MKKDLFWKIIAIIFLFLFSLYIWTNSIYIYRVKLKHIVKVNKITGRVYYLKIPSEKGWKRMDKIKKEIKDGKN